MNWVVIVVIIVIIIILLMYVFCNNYNSLKGGVTGEEINSYKLFVVAQLITSKRNIILTRGIIPLGIPELILNQPFNLLEFCEITQRDNETEYDKIATYVYDLIQELSKNPKEPMITSEEILTYMEDVISDTFRALKKNKEFNRYFFLPKTIDYKDYINSLHNLHKYETEDVQTTNGIIQKTKFVTIITDLNNIILKMKNRNLIKNLFLKHA